LRSTSYRPVTREDQSKRLDEWLRAISYKKAHPITRSQPEAEASQAIFEAYNASLRACGAFDFDDLLLLAYQLLTDYPQIADFYRRLYKYICIDEAQDLNEAQYAVVQCFLREYFKNAMMVGDPKQAIYGFNASSPRYPQVFAQEFGAQQIELTDNFRSSRIIVQLARKISPNSSVEGQLSIRGDVKVFIGKDEANEAELIVREIDNLLRNGHPDVEAKSFTQGLQFLGAPDSHY
jgi:DNA helicase II / ATP-dependent DNA helicase PcrA